MKFKSYTTYTVIETAVAALLVSALTLVTFFLFEPIAGRAVVDTFTVTQEITDEISFLVAPNDVSMEGALSGLTGGFATGTTEIVIQTNDTDGYNMTIVFSSTTAMVANNYATNQGYINDYSLTATSVPDYNWTEDGTAAEFGYSAVASTSVDMDAYFLDNGTNCNQAGGSATVNRCWMTPSTTAQQVINRTSGPAAGGATTTFYFRVAVPSAPSPALPADFYTATATLTATNN